jgi:stearoyl-CoA desaturase (delta-9 desaturase)
MIIHIFNAKVDPMIILIFFFALWYSSLFFQTFFQHRYAAHGAFTMNKSWERVFYVLTYIAQGSSYMSPRAYAIMHRMHHAYTDTEMDPHSPSYSPNILSMMWRTRNIYEGIYKEKFPVEARFAKNLPEWRGFERWANSTVSRVLWILGYIVFFIFFASSPWLYLLLPVVFAMGAFHGAIINWFAHKFGYVNFKLRNTAHNLLSVDLLMLGESYHNNHHKHPTSINFGNRWHEIDPVYFFIRLLIRIKVLHIAKPAMVKS